MFFKKDISTKELAIARTATLIVSLLVLLVVINISLVMGTIKFSLSDAYETIYNSFNGGNVNQIIFSLRVPRILTGVLIGINLGVAGALLQAILRNPMASPNIIGVNAGAAFLAVLIMTVLPSLSRSIPLFAFLGALLATLFIYLLSNVSKNSNTVHIVLAGIAVSNLLKAITSGLMTLNTDTLDITYSWLLGSLSGRTWTSLELLLPYSIFALSITIYISPKVNLFSLGDELAQSMGLSIGAYRVLIMFLASILAGSSVSVAGTIGFIGLIAPHSARMIIGNDYRFLIPLSGIFGAILLVVSDTVARVVFQPVELSVGIVTSVLGAPFFLWLLFNARSSR